MQKPDRGIDRSRQCNPRKSARTEGCLWAAFCFDTSLKYVTILSPSPKSSLKTSKTKPPQPIVIVWVKYGQGDWIRTSDPLLPNKVRGLPKVPYFLILTAVILCLPISYRNAPLATFRIPSYPSLPPHNHPRHSHVTASWDTCPHEFSGYFLPGLLFSILTVTIKHS